MSIPDNYIGEPGYPAPWTTSTPLEGLRDTDEAMIISLAPDVCRSPGTPIPYPVVDFCGHDENYTTSVRYTGQRVMVLRSNTSHVHGDEPGIGKGVVSNTVGGISEPITHAAQVRAEGSPVIRHLDRFHMNNRNTVGEAIFIRDTATYPAPKDDDPLPGSIKLAALGSAALPQVSPSPAPTPSPQTTPRPPGQVIRPDFPQWRRPPPTNPTPPSVGTRMGRLGRFGARVGGVLGALLWPSPLADGTLPYWAFDLTSPDPIRRRAAEEAQRLYEGNPALRPDLEEWFREETEHLPQPLPRAQASEDDDANTGQQPLPDLGPSVRVDEDKHRARCMVASYRIMEKRCKLVGMQAHHIVPDWTLRTGTRAEAKVGLNRIQNMPGYWDGNSICVKGNARVHGTEHHEAHLADGPIEAIGMSSTPMHTAPLGQVVVISVAAMVAVRPECSIEIVVAVMKQFGILDQLQLVRAKQYPPLHPLGLKALSTGAKKGAAGTP